MLRKLGNSIGLIRDFLMEAKAKAKALAQHKDRKDKQERAYIAKVFNDRYCYRQRYVKDRPELTGTAMYGFLPDGGNAWMCPECNRIYHPISCSVFSGLQYPRCCYTEQGNRLSHGIKVE